MLSVIIPSRNISSWKFTQKTVDDLFNKATDEIEVICILDGYVLEPPLKERANLTVIHHETSQGMRQGINLGANLAKGKYIMKCDDHCMFDQGFDEKLAADCDDNWLVVPSRYSLNGQEWIRKYGPIDYDYLTYPFFHDDQFGYGFHGKKWHGERGFAGGYFDREKKLKNVLIDDIIAFQGSCWFMTKDNFDRIGGMQQEGYRNHQEAQELLFKTWLSGGRCVVNKKTYYCHLHKGQTYGRGYHISKKYMIDSAVYSTDVWMNNKWPGQIHKFKWLIEKEKWWPLGTWPDDWDNPDRWKNYDYSMWYREYRRMVGAT
jgi:glycosyltransferase involved in cell wall biosynthesis